MTLTLVLTHLTTVMGAHSSERRAEAGQASTIVGIALLLLLCVLGMPPWTFPLILLIALTTINTDTREAAESIRTHLGLIVIATLLGVVSIDTKGVTVLAIVLVLLDMSSLVQTQLIYSLSRSHYLLAQGALSAVAWTSLVNGLDTSVIVMLLTKLGAGIGAIFLPSMYRGMGDHTLRYTGTVGLLQALILLTLADPSIPTSLPELVGIGGLLIIGTWHSQGLTWTGPSHILATSTSLTLTVVALGMTTNSVWLTGILTNTGPTWVLCVGMVCRSSLGHLSPTSSHSNSRTSLSQPCNGLVLTRQSGSNRVTSSVPLTRGLRMHNLAMNLTVSGLLTTGISLSKGILLAKILQESSLGYILAALSLGVLYMVVMGSVAALTTTSSQPLHGILPLPANCVGSLPNQTVTLVEVFSAILLLTTLAQPSLTSVVLVA